MSTVMLYLQNLPFKVYSDKFRDQNKDKKASAGCKTLKELVGLLRFHITTSFQNRGLFSVTPIQCSTSFFFYGKDWA